MFNLIFKGGPAPDSPNSHAYSCGVINHPLELGLSPSAEPSAKTEQRSITSASKGKGNFQLNVELLLVGTSSSI